ncbi:MAG: hypothetical protein FJ398_26675 [Verrucomicrobia bacterium]|nr:hypothetical protein [Verrucomicrobiota bacterium]
MKDLSKMMDGARRVREVFDEIGKIGFSHTDDDSMAKETAIRLGTYESMRAQAANRPRGSVALLAVQDGRLFLVRYFWGHAESKDNGWAGFCIELAPFKSRPDGEALFSKFVMGLIDAEDLDGDLIDVSLHCPFTGGAVN